jgi:dihydroxyacetone kinase-like protein
MADARSLVAVFEAITENLEKDRDDINHLDRDDHDTGDNMVENFRLVTNTLQKQVGQGENVDVGAALGQAAQVLRSDGKGATAKIYASGLNEAATKLSGQNTFAMGDLLPLLEGLLGGAQSAGAGQGQGGSQGSLLDVLLPAIGAYSQAKRNGDDDMTAILGALLETRRGATGTARSSSGYGRASGRSTAGEVDPGAAAAASLLEGLFGALLKGGLKQAGGGGMQSSVGGARPGGGSASGKYGGPSTLPDVGQEPQQPQRDEQPAQPRSSGNPIIDILGSLFGGR